MPSTITWTVGFGLIIASFAAKMLSTKGSLEPPEAPQSIPLIGHIIGLTRRSFNYYVDLSKQTGLPIFTISLPGQKMYVVTRPDLIQLVQKQHKILAFPPIEAKFAATVCGIGPKTQAILDKNVNGDEGDFGLSVDSYKVIHSAMKPGPELDAMNRDMLSHVAAALDELCPEKSEARTVKMSAWLRDVITVATTKSVYGPLNPFNDKAVTDAFWDFESGLMKILLGFLPTYTASKALAGREKVSKAFERYYEVGGMYKGSAWARERYEVGVKHNVAVEDIARFEVGGSIAILVNTAPTTFWLLFLLHSQLDAATFTEIRGEIDAVTNVGADGTRNLDVTSLKESCPLLLSAYQEVLRYRSMGTSVREVMEDTHLDGFLLRKGAMLQMPSRIIHLDAELWGSDVEAFNPRRFLASERKKKRDASFRGFGGGKTLCPGRHFATNEILAVVACFIARFDMRPIDPKGWVIPSVENTNVAAVVMEPDEDVEVLVTRREGLEDAKWRISLTSSDNIFSIVAEDAAEQ